LTAEAIVVFLVGFLQPFVQEALVGWALNERAATIATILFSFGLALIAVWVTGGLSGGQVPSFSIADPSPLFGFLVAKLAPVYALSQVVFNLFYKQVHAVPSVAPGPVEVGTG
jgi:hypothetical protein